MDGPPLPGMVLPPVPWRQPAAVAPSLSLVRDAADVLVRYRYAGVERIIRMPFIIWMSIKLAARLGAFEDLGDHAAADGWTPWGAGTGRIRLAVCDVHIRYTYDDIEEVRKLPVSIWEQLVVAIRTRAVDDLDSIRRRGDQDAVAGGV